MIKNKKIFLRTFGCQMNEYDSELIRSILLKAGYVLSKSEEATDIILLNTCSVRETANRKIFGLVDLLRHQTKNKPILIGILGCMATDLKEHLITNKKREVDFIVGPDSYRRLPAIIAQAQKNKKIADITLSKKENYDDIYPQRQKGINAWVAITRGCNNFCSFCIVPYARGRERSRKPKNILAEIRKLVVEGYPQVTLLGQNVNSYNADGYDFPLLLDDISQINGLKRIRFMSPHPKDFPTSLIDIIARQKNVCKHIHLPLQSGSNRILRLMNRTYTKEQFLRLVRAIRQRIPQIAITTDIIIGFPTETEKDFRDTVDVFKKASFDAAFIFKYSPRTGTLAERRYKDDVSPEVKKERIISLNALQQEFSLKQNMKLIGQTQEILLEEERQPGHWRGRTDTNKIVSVYIPKAHAGKCVNVIITSASVNGLTGKLL